MGLAFKTALQTLIFLIAIHTAVNKDVFLEISYTSRGQVKTCGVVRTKSASRGGPFRRQSGTALF